MIFESMNPFKCEFQFQFLNFFIYTINHHQESTFLIIFIFYQQLMKTRSRIRMTTIAFFIALLCTSTVLSFFTQVTIPIQSQAFIDSVSLQPTGYTKPQVSMVGGSTIYVQGGNFKQDAVVKLINFGQNKTFECTPQNGGVQTGKIACQIMIGDTYFPDDYERFYIEVTTGSFPAISCQIQTCLVTFRTSKTGLLEQIFPRSFVGTQEVNFMGIHRITDLGDSRSKGEGQIDSLIIGNTICSMIDVINEDQINKDAREPIACEIYRNMEAGQYNIYQKTGSGYASNSLRMKTASLFSGKPSSYEGRVIPSITAMNQNSGNLDGNQFNVTGYGFSSDVNAYNCKIGSQPCEVVAADKNFATIRVPAGSSSSTLNFKGNGFSYVRYQGAINIADNLASFRAGSISNLKLETKTATQLSSAQIYEQEQYTEYLKGWFFAPETGKYRFSAVGDDQVHVYFKETPNVPITNSDTTTIISNFGASSSHFLPLVNRENTVSKDLTLEKGKYYSMEVFSINSWSKGRFKVMVETPKLAAYSASDNPNPQWHLHKFVISHKDFSPYNDPQVYTVELKSATKFKLRYLDTIDGKPVYRTTDDILTSGNVRSSFISQLWKLPQFNWYSPAVVYDSTTEILTITFSRYRSSTKKIYLIKDGGTPIALQPKAHGGPLQGTYKMSINGKSVQPAVLDDKTDIPFNTPDWKLQESIRKLYPFPDYEVYVKQMQGVGFEDQISFIIQFVGVRQKINIVIDSSNVQQKTVDGNTVATILTESAIRQFDAERFLFNPVPYDFLYQQSTGSTLNLAVNNIPALSLVDNTYTFDSSKQVSITAWSYATNKITFTLNKNLNISAIHSVVMGGSYCASIVKTSSSVSQSSFECSIYQLQAGNDQKPQILITGNGFAIDTSNNVPFNISLIVSSITPNNCNFRGQIKAVINGNGFPVDLNSAYVRAHPFSIQICGKQVSNILKTSNKQIQIVVPANVEESCPSGSTKVIFGQISTIFTFTYRSSSTSITSILPENASPISKGTLKITGTGFGPTNTINVFLRHYINSIDFDNQYSLTVINSTSTQINAILTGGRTGEYKLVVVMQGQGAIIHSSPFTFATFIDSISPTSGTLGGGYNLTITGRNFLGGSQLNAFVGTTGLCKILSWSSTQIICQVPANPDPSTLNKTVAVTTRIVQESICAGSCNFTFIQEAKYNLKFDSQSGILNAGNSNNFVSVDDTSNTIVIYADVPFQSTFKVFVGSTQITSFTNTSKTITFSYPSRPYGIQNIKVQFTDGSGKVHLNYPALSVFTTVASITAFARIDGFVLGNTFNGSTQGADFSIKGTGFPISSTSSLKLTLQCGSSGIFQDLKIKTQNANNLFFEIPARPNGTKCQIKFKYTFDKTLSDGSVTKSLLYTYDSAQTPTATATLSAQTITITSANGVLSAQLIFLNSEDKQTNSIYSIQKKATGTNEYIVVEKGVQQPIPAGKYNVRVSTQKGFARASISKSYTANPTVSPSVAIIPASKFGGKSITLSGGPFIDSSHSMENNFVTICGRRATILDAKQTEITIQAPSMIATSYQPSGQQFVKKSQLYGTPFGDDVSANPILSFDGSQKTMYASSTKEAAGVVCEIGMDFGQATIVQLHSFRFMANPLWTRAADYLAGGVFQGYDGTQWQEINAIDTANVHTGWNYFKDETLRKISKIRFTHSYVQNKLYSKCQLAQFQVFGKAYANITDSQNISCTISVSNHKNQVVDIATPKVEYRNQVSGIINSITPAYGPSKGGYNITLSGTNLKSSSQISLVIDGISCVVVSHTATQIVCTTGPRSTPPAKGNSFDIKVGGNSIFVKCKPFIYIDKFSDSDTWQGQTPPRKGDSLYVPKGQTLLVDQSTQQLYAIIVDGKIIFENGPLSSEPLQLHANYFVLNEGSQFQAGTQEQPYLRKLTITMYGDYYDKQLPTFGNKGIGCINCKFSMHGKKIGTTWTMISQAALAGATTINVEGDISDWENGDEIVIASTDLDHNQAERRTIKAIDKANKIITLNESLIHDHQYLDYTYSWTDFHGVSQTKRVVLRAEVGLLTRNIKMQGDPNYPDSLKHGSHLLLAGKESQGLVGHIAYAQFTRCGQPKIVARYCTHFHMAGQVPESYVRGISVHDSFARVLTIHGTHYLTVQKNVGYRVQGHNFFVQDGIQTNNVIQDNLAIGSLESFLMTQSDITVASFWITNPYNTVRRNHAAGGDFYGFWYEVMEHPTGPSATSDICPMGMQVQESANNVAHSNGRFGLRIFKLSSRKYPCQGTKNNYLLNPYQENQPIHSVFDNYIVYRNLQSGFLGEKLGYMTIQNFVAIDNVKGGLQFHKTNFTHPITHPVVAKNCLIIGLSESMKTRYDQNSFDNDIYRMYNGQDTETVLHRTGTRGLFLPRTDGFIAEGLHFDRFYNKMTPLQSCSQCWHFKLWVVGSKSATFRNISYGSNINNYIFWQKWQREVLIDQDGSLTKNWNFAGKDASKTPFYVTHYRPNLIDPNSITRYNATLSTALLDASTQTSCYYDNSTYSNIFDQQWNKSVICDKSAALRGILFTNLEPVIDFKGVDLRIKQISTPDQNITSKYQEFKTKIATDYSSFSAVQINNLTRRHKQFFFGTANQIVIKKQSLDIIGAFAMPVNAGKMYNVHWKEGIDFQSLSIAPSPYWAAGQRAILRFNYTDQREQFLISRFFKNKPDGTVLERADCMGLGTVVPAGPQRVVDDKATEDVDESQIPYLPYTCTYYTSLTSLPNCKNGEYVNDRVNRFLFVCISGDSQHKDSAGAQVDNPRGVDEWIYLTGKKCHSEFGKSNCPVAKLQNGPKSPAVWSNSSVWPNGIIPGTQTDLTIGKVAVNATVQFKYHMFIDVNALNLSTLIVDGYLEFGRKDSSYDWGLLTKASVPSTLIDRSITLHASYIWIRDAKARLIIGNSTKPFASVAEIVLYGQKSDRYMVIDGNSAETVQSGNKMLAVTGSAQLYGMQPSVVWTRLSSVAFKGAKQLILQSQPGWKDGDQIVIGATYSGKNESEKHTLDGASLGRQIKLKDALVFEHFGSTDDNEGNVSVIPRSNNDKGLGLDNRAAIGLLTRNVRIRRADDNDWGCRVIVAQTLIDKVDSTGKLKIEAARGRIIFKGVQVKGCGQKDSTMAGVRFSRVGKQPLPYQFLVGNEIAQAQLKYQDQFEHVNYTNIIAKSSIHSCNGYCMYVDDQSRDINIDNNVFYYAERQIVYVGTVRFYSFTNNFLSWAFKRSQLSAALAQSKLTEDVACYEQFMEVIDPKNDRVFVNNNVAQGSEGQGFVFPFMSCDHVRQGYYNFVDNTAGSCQIAFMFEKLKKSSPSCISATSAIGYSSQVGLQANPPGPWIKVIYDNMFFADNHRGITLRYAHETDDNTLQLKNSQFLGFSRNRQDLYSTKKNTYCDGGYALRGFTATIAGQTFPLKKPAMIHDIICNQQAFDFKAFLTNVYFKNYVYKTSAQNPGPSHCQRMSVLKRHALASDGTAPHYLAKSPCINCQKESFMNIDPPSPSWFGWFGGCGQMQCTGPDNVILHDTDGVFVNETLGIAAPTQIYGRGVNGTGNTNRSDCQKIANHNYETYICKGERLVLLQFESVADDRQKRIIWPIQIYDYENFTGQQSRGGNSNFYSLTNGWREWEWDGPEPMNLRIARFWSVVRKNTMYNITYASQPPKHTIYQLNRRNPKDNLIPGPLDYIVAKVYYPLPNSIEVYVKINKGPNANQHTIVKPQPEINGQYVKLEQDLDQSTNKSFLQACGANNFRYKEGVIEFVINSLDNCQVKVSLSNFIMISVRVNVPFFDFYKNKETSFISNIAAFLNIDPGRFKILGLREGSTIINATASYDSTGDDESDFRHLNSESQRLVQAILSRQVQLGGPILEATAYAGVVSANGSPFVLTDNTLIIILATVIPVVSLIVIITIVGCVVYRRRRVKVGSEDSFADINSRDELSNKPSRDFIKVQDIKKLEFNLSEED